MSGVVGKLKAEVKGYQRGPGNPNFKRMISQRRVYEWVIKDVVIRYDETWEKIFKEVGEELGYDSNDVKGINTAWWRYVNEMLGHVELPTIRVKNFFAFVPSASLLKNYCNRIGNIIERVYTGEDNRWGENAGGVKKMEKHLGRLLVTCEKLEVEEARMEVYRKRRREMFKKKLEEKERIKTEKQNI